MRGVPREKARSEPVVSAPPTPRRCPSAARPAAVSSQAPRIACVQQECNRPQTQRRRKRRKENANEIPLTPLNTIPLPPGPAHGSHAANTRQICYEQSRLPTRCALARRPAARQQKGAVSRREPRAIGSRRVFHAVPHDRHHLSKPLKRRCGQQKPETSLHLKAILRGVPREKARSEPVVSTPPAPRRCPAAYPQKPMRTRVRSRCLNTEWSFLWKNKRKSCRSEKRIFRLGS